jgi:putative endonuclease
MNYVYILRCSDDTLYIGWTNDLEKRVKTHNEQKGARYTKTRTPVRLVYYEAFETKQEALKREFDLKKLSRKHKLYLINNDVKTNVYLFKSLNQEEDSKKLLKQKLKEDYNLSLKHLNLKYNKYQKPYLNLPVYFNISHSSNLVALVISKYDVGIDLEKIQARKKRLADKILSENELKEYQENKSNSYLIKKWTEKEAYFKLLGTGLILKDLRKDYSKFVKTYEVKDKENHYYLSIATKEKNNINVLEESIKI